MMLRLGLREDGTRPSHGYGDLHVASLGVVLCEMVTGRAPFTGETNSHIAVAILENEPVPVSHLAPNAPSELQRIVRKSLAKDRGVSNRTASDRRDGQGHAHA